MPTFSRLSVPAIAAGIFCVAMGAILWVEAGSVKAVAGEDVSAAAAAAVPAQADAFAQGLAAYQAGDLPAAVERWQVAADAGHIGAQWNLAQVYSGDNPLHDAVRHLQYLRLVAGQHDPDLPPGPRSAVTVEALIELGRLYATGDPEAGLEPQPARAYSLFEHTATLYGHPRAQHYLGLMYLRGEGAKQNVSRAVRWLFLAARKNFAPSQAALGDVFWQRGMTQQAGTEDRLRGLMWFALASESARGDKARQLFSDRYAAALDEASDDERSKVEVLVARWNERNAPAVVVQAMQEPAAAPVPAAQ